MTSDCPESPYVLEGAGYHKLPTFIIPAYNEEKRIRNTLNALINIFPGSEYLVVFDGQDHTPDVVSAFPNVRLISYNTRLGKGRAVMEGLKEISPEDVIVFIDADLPVTVNDIKRAIERFGKADMLIASRQYVNFPMSRLYLHDMFNSLAKMFFPQLKQFRDWQAGFKVINGQSINKVKNELIMNDFIFDTNLTYSFLKRGMKVIEYPMVWHHEESGSKVSNGLFKVILMDFFSLIKLRVYYSPLKGILSSGSYTRAQEFILKILR